MWALYKLQAKAWFANMFNKMDFIMTFLFLMVLGSFIAFKFDGGYDDPTLWRLNITMISSIVLLMVASSAINTFGISFFEMKESVLLKRIGATNITKFEAVASFILWGMTSMLFIIGWMAIIVGFCQIPALAENNGGLLYVDGSLWANVNWIGVIVSILITMVSFYAIAFFFVSISKNSTAYQMTATFYFFLISFLGGAYTPNADILWMDIISFLSPLGWGRDLMSASMSGANAFDFVNGYEIPALMTETQFLDMVNKNFGLVGSGYEFTTVEQFVTEINSKTLGDLGYTLAEGSTLNPSILETNLGDLDANFVQNKVDAIILPTSETNGIKAIGNIAMPIVYGSLAGGFAAMFFKWD